MIDDSETDLGSPEGVKAHKERSRLKKTDLDDVLRGLMSHKPGRDWVFDTLSTCRVFQSSFSSDALLMAFAEGEQNVGRRLLANLLRVSPEGFITMLQEQNDG